MTWRKENERGGLLGAYTDFSSKVLGWRRSVLTEIMNDWRSPKGQERGRVLAEHLSYGYVMDSFFAK